MPSTVSCSGCLRCLLLSLLIVAGAAGDGPRAVAQPAADAEPALRGPRGTYEVYAPAGRDLADVQSRIEHAIDRWKTAFGGSPRPFAVVLFENAAATRSYDYSPIRDRGRVVLPWVKPREAERGRDGGSLLAALGGGQAQAQERGLSHELCHTFLIGHVTAFREARGIEKPDSLEGRPSYGAWGVPDWLDEAVAIWCESPEMRADRRAHQFEGSADARIPLPRLLRMVHPSFKGVLAIARERLAAQEDSSETVMLEIPEGGLQIPGNESDQRAFYPQTWVFTEWLVERAGPGVLRSFAEAYAARHPTEVVLRSVAWLPNTVNELQAEWQSWMRSQ